MMKYFKLAILLVIFGASPTKVFASSVVDESPSDMLRGMDDKSENENADAASKWGMSGSKIRANKLTIAKPLAPIDDSSFSTGGNRAPASMREPATVKPVVMPGVKALPPANTMIRTLREKKAVQEASVIVNDLGFFPSTLFVTKGIPVRLYLTGASQRSQCIIMDSFGVRRQIKSQKIEEVTFIPKQAGKFAFTCPMNGAKGTMIVKELEFSQPASRGVASMVTSDEDEAANAGKDDTEIKEDDFTEEFRVNP